MLFLIGHDQFAMSFFIKKDEKLVLSRDILGSQKMSTKLQMSLKHKMQIEYIEDCGQVTMKSCLLNDKQRKNHCKVVDKDKLCIGNVPYFVVKVIRPHYVGEVVYEQWNWVYSSTFEYICKDKYDLLNLIAKKTKKPLLNLDKLKSCLDLPKDSFNLLDKASGKEDSLLMELIEPAIMDPKEDISRIILTDYIFAAVATSSIEKMILELFSKCFNAKVEICNDTQQDLLKLEKQFENYIVLPISNESCSIKTLSFQELYSKVTQDTLEQAASLNKSQPPEQQTYQEGANFMDFFLNSSVPVNVNSEIQTQSYNTQESIVIPDPIPIQQPILSQASISQNRSFMASQMQFNQSYKLNKKSEPTSLSQAFGISQEEIKKRLMRKKSDSQPNKKQKIQEIKPDVIVDDTTVDVMQVDTPVEVKSVEPVELLEPIKPSKPTSMPAKPTIVSGTKEQMSRSSKDNVKVVELTNYYKIQKLNPKYVIPIHSYYSNTMERCDGKV